MSQHKTIEEVRASKAHSTFQLDKKQATDMYNTACQDFCSHLRYLVNTLWLKNQRDDDICDLKRRVGIATNSNPVTIIKLAGPYFFKYRESLSNRKVDFFLNKDYKEEVEELATQQNISVELKSAGEVIAKIKDTWKSFNEQEKHIILTKSVEMLSQYARFLTASKRLIELGGDN